MYVKSKKKVLIGLALFFVLGIILFSGCAGRSDSEKTIYLTIGSNPSSLDSRRQEESEGIFLCQQIYEGLVVLNQKTAVVPAGAEKWEVSSDGLTYTFILRQDAKWSNGDLVTAYDYEYAWLTAVSPEFANKRAEDFFYIKNARAYNEGLVAKENVGIKALSDHVLQVILEHPVSYFIEILAKPLFSPVHKKTVLSNERWLNETENIPCNGPFKIKDYALNYRIELLKNPYYYDRDKVKTNKININISENTATLLSMFETGQVDFCKAPPPSEIPRLLAEKKLKTEPKLATYFYELNINKAPLNNLKVRKALALAINRDFLVEKVTKGGQKPAMALVPYGMPDAKEVDDFRNIGGNLFENFAVETAQNLLKEAGFPGGAGFPKLVLKYNTNEGHKMIAEAIQEMWKKNLNIDIELQNEEWKVFIASRDKGTFEIARMGSVADVADPSTFLLSYLSDSEQNITKWQNKQYDKLVKEAEKEQDRQKRFLMLHQAEKMLIDEMPIIPLYYYTSAALISKKLHGYVNNSLDYWYFKEAYLD